MVASATAGVVFSIVLWNVLEWLRIVRYGSTAAHMLRGGLVLLVCMLPLGTLVLSRVALSRFIRVRCAQELGRPHASTT
jgi:hypothetical protein